MADDLYYGDAGEGQRIYCATAIVSGMVAFGTAAGTGGPLLWNGTTDTEGRIIAVSWAVTTASAAAGAIGWTSNTTQITAPTSTTGIDSIQNCYIGGPKPKITAYRVGTVANAGANFGVLGAVGTTAISSLPDTVNYVELKRSITLPPLTFTAAGALNTGQWFSIAGSTALTTSVIQVSVWWEEKVVR